MMKIVPILGLLKKRKNLLKENSLASMVFHKISYNHQ
uniref:Uncharacterized protein n=1 Tax=Lepeophtheirus salmonis TaxID=72036 RepID=A0A0K2UYL0_LEPSM